MNPNTPAPKTPETPTPDDAMTRKEKEDLQDQIEEFEGPDRREIRGSNKEPADDPGVAHS
ncbi:MAG TPA: hypothetical protein VF958_02375 [Thermoanaerobaculia bacterium]|jgi:hypothetical protein